MRLAARLQRLSMRSRLLLGILIPVGLLVMVNAASLYRQALAAADTAYDRTLLASAKAIAELLEVKGTVEAPRLQANLPYSALEAFEADNRSRMFFKISGFEGEMVGGFADLPGWHGTLPLRGNYAALVDFYDDVYQGQPVRVAVLLQPVAGLTGQGLATIQVAETLELREALARQLLLDTLWRQAAVLAVIAAVVWWVVAAATRPVRKLSAAILARDAQDLSPIELPQAPRELMPLIAATNDALGRQALLLAHQKRFVRDASHQLRTPLAVLKAQVQSAQRGDVAAAQALREIEQTVDGATRLANQMLALAKVEQLRQSAEPLPVQDWAALIRAVALDLAPLIAEQQLDFEIATEPAAVAGHEWALRELTRNLLHNAISYTPVAGRLGITLRCEQGRAELLVADSGPGLSPAQQAQLFLPFAAGQPGRGTGLGLAICQEIVRSLRGQIRLENRVENHLKDGQITGMDARVSLPLAG